jgi:hypothetical protein
MHTTKTVISRTFSKVGLMSPESAEFWKSLFEIAGVILLGATFVAGLGFWYFGGKVSEFQEERLRTFDKDLTTAKGELSIQEQRAAGAEKQLALVKQSTSNAEKDVARANQRAAEANEEAGRANAKAAEANERASEFNKSAEELKAKNLELQKAMLPRLVIIRGGKNGNPLLPFAGTSVVLASVNDREARRAAGSLRAALDGAAAGADWKVTTAAPMNDFFGVSDGVWIELPKSFHTLSDEEQFRLLRAQQALVKFLKDCGWIDVWSGPAPDDNFPGLLRITVGFQPVHTELLR